MILMDAPMEGEKEDIETKIMGRHVEVETTMWED